MIITRCNVLYIPKLNLFLMTLNWQKSSWEVFAGAIEKP